METEKRHIIHRQILELEVNRNMPDKEIQTQYQQKLADEMLKTMEAMFDMISTDKEKLIVDKLSLDLGEVTEDEFMHRFQEVLNDHLSRMINSPSDSGDGKVRKVRKGRQLSEVFLFFLQFGYMPWWAASGRLQDLEELPESTLKNTEFTDILHSLLERADIRKRFAHQFSASFNLRFLATLFPHYRQLTESLVLNLADIILQRKRTWSQRILRSIILERIWYIQCRENDDSKMLIHFQERVIASMTAELNLSVDDMSEHFPQIDKMLLQNLVEHYQQTKEIRAAEHFEDEQEAFIINNSGLVILWPYLGKLYKNLGLLTENDLFADEEMHEKAVLISQYLVNTNPENQEHQLVLNKILHGWPIHKAVRGYLVLNEDERAGLDEFLEEVIRNWPILKNTSIEGFRETFLQRPGTISKTNIGWSLKVQRRGVDILRDNLPWPISIINLSWMHTIVYVKW